MATLRTILIMAILAISCMSGSPAAQDMSEVGAGDMSIEQNLNTPEVPDKARKVIIAHMDNIKRTLKKHGLQVSSIRNGEVVAVTIPCEMLFTPNQTELKNNASRLLTPFSSLLKYPTMYKVIVAVHSDNTGEQAYCDDLTADRANNINDFLCVASGTSGTNLIPYGVGMDEPLNDNCSIQNRSRNRRVEIYIIPEHQMIEMSRSGRLAQ